MVRYITKRACSSEPDFRLMISSTVRHLYHRYHPPLANSEVGPNGRGELRTMTEEAGEELGSGTEIVAK